MASNAKLRERLDPGDLHDPREGYPCGGAEIIDIATRNVLPRVMPHKRSHWRGMATGIAIVAALGVVTLWATSNTREELQMVRFDLPESRPWLEPAPGDSLTVQTPEMDFVTGAPPPGIPAPPPSSVLSEPPQMAIAPANLASPGNPHASPTVIFDSRASSGAPGLMVPGTGTSAARRGDASDDTASAASFDRATTVSQGTLIPAVLETAIDTDIPGYVRAIVSTDVKSFDGRRVLVPRSSRLVGQYKSGLSAGQSRAFVIWTRLTRPDGVSVNLGSPATGKVDGQFFNRFGSAKLLSVVGGDSTGGSQSAAAAADQQNGQSGPTIRVRQGEPIRVFTAKDLDLSKVK